MLRFGQKAYIKSYSNYKFFSKKIFGGISPCHEKIYYSLNQKPSAKTLTIFFDSKKAFDTIDHTILLKNYITIV